jgi:hypothetical protein
MLWDTLRFALRAAKIVIFITPYFICLVFWAPARGAPTCCKNRNLNVVNCASKREPIGDRLYGGTLATN